MTKMMFSMLLCIVMLCKPNYGRAICKPRNGEMVYGGGRIQEKETKEKDMKSPPPSAKRDRSPSAVWRQTAKRALLKLLTQEWQTKYFYIFVSFWFLVLFFIWIFLFCFPSFNFSSVFSSNYENPTTVACFKKYGV